MGSLFSPKTSTTKSSTAPPPAVAQAYTELMNRASGASQGATTTPFTSLQNQALSSFGSIPGQYMPQAAGYAQQGASAINPADIQRYMNPFQSQVIDATQANISENNAQQRAALKGNAIAQGALGGSRQGVAQAELARQQNLASGQTIAGLNAANYNQGLAGAQSDRDAAARGASQYSGLESTALAGAGAQFGAGAAQQGQNTAELTQPYQQAQWLSSIYGGLGPLLGTNSTQETPGPSIFQSLLGAGIAAAGAYAGIPPSVTSGAKGGASPFNAHPSARGGRIGYADGGGIATMPASQNRAGEMIANATQLAQTLRQSRDVGGPVNPFQTWNDMDTAQGIGAGSFGGLPAIGIGGPPQGISPPRQSLVAAEGGIGPTAPPNAAAGISGGDAPPDTDPTGGNAGIGSPTPSPTQGGNKDWADALLATGLGIMGSKSPFLGQAIGEGGTQGLNVIRANKAVRATAAEKQRAYDLDVRKINEAAARAKETLAETSRHNKAEEGVAGVQASKPFPIGTDALGHTIYATRDKDGQPVPVDATGGKGNQGLLSPDAVDLITSQVLSGDSSAMVGYARTPALKAQIMNALAEKASARGMDGAAVAAQAAAYMGDKAAQRSAGTRAAQVGMAASEANQMADIALEASQKVPRGNFVPWTKAVQAVQTGTSSPEMAQFVTATTSLVNAYARAVSPLGAPTDAMRQHAEQMLNVAQGPEAYAAVIAQMKREMTAALNAPVEIRQNLINRGLGKPEGATGAGSQPKSLPEGYTKDKALSEAKAAIASGKPKAAIIERLQGFGIDTSGL